LLYLKILKRKIQQQKSEKKLMFNIILKTIFIFFSFVSAAYAYLGLGVGGGVIAATIGVIVAIISSLFGLIWFPVKRLLKKKKRENQQNKVD
jgi:hypothetical protein